MIKFNAAHFINSEEIMQKLCHPETATRGREKGRKEQKVGTKLIDVKVLIQNRKRLENDDFSGFNDVLLESHR